MKLEIPASGVSDHAIRMARLGLLMHRPDRERYGRNGLGERLVPETVRDIGGRATSPLLAVIGRALHADPRVVLVPFVQSCRAVSVLVGGAK